MPSRSSSHAVRPAALEQRARLVDPDVRDEARAPRPRAARRRARPVAARREPAGVAVRQRSRAGREQRRRVLGHAPAALDLVRVELRARARTRDRPAASRSSAQARLTAVGRERGEHGRRGVEVVPAAGPRARSPYAAAIADRRRAADRERPDRVGDLGGGSAARARPPRRAAGAGRARRRVVLEPDDLLRLERPSHASAYGSAHSDSESRGPGRAHVRRHCPAARAQSGPPSGGARSAAEAELARREAHQRRSASERRGAGGTMGSPHA